MERLIRGLLPSAVPSWNGATRTLTAAASHRFRFTAFENLLSEARIRGLTAYNAFVDELTLQPEEYYEYVLSRLTFAGSKLIATTNTAAPRHWVKRRIDGGLFGFDRKFLMTDNPRLNAEDRAAVASSYIEGSPRFKRYILGQWVGNEGAVFPEIPLGGPPVGGQLIDVVLGCDYGSTSASAAVRADVYEMPDGGLHFHFPTSKYITPTDGAVVPPNVQAARIIQWAGPDPSVMFLDPNAIAFAAGFGDAPFRCEAGNNAVEDGIINMQDMFDCGEVSIADNAENAKFIEELEGYIWDQKATERGQDKPVKSHDHSVDAARYLLYSYRYTEPRVTVMSRANIAKILAERRRIECR